MLGPDDLVLCTGTLPRIGFRERVAVASGAGFSGISLFASDYRAAREEGLSDPDLRALLDDHGLEVAELDPLLDWVPGFESGPADVEGADRFRATEDEFYAIADVVGGRSINAVYFAPTRLPRKVLSEAFGALCDRAAGHGLSVVLEFMPWTHVPDAPSAWQIVELAGRDNGGLMFDSWHNFRGGHGSTLPEGVPGNRVFGIQLSDAPAEAEKDAIAETLQRRRVPGDGDIDLPALVRSLRHGGCIAPPGVEIYSKELAARPPAEIAQISADSVRAVLAKASG